MKKLSILFGAFIMLASVSSCKKDYTCTCTLTTGTTTTPYSFSIPNATQSNAKSTCSTYQTNYNTAGAGLTTASCGI